MAEGKLHKNNKHQGKYDMQALIKAHEKLGKYVALNKYNTLSIDFFDNKAVRELNKALLKLYYNIKYWEIPEQALTPAIPGRADYIHYVAELFGKDNHNKRCLEIGVGASCIYPIIACHEYNWDFVASDIELASLENSQKIIDNNPSLKNKVELRHQTTNQIFEGIIQQDEHFDLSICNPPFHDSAQSAQSGTLRKLKNLKKDNKTKLSLNFAGSSNELWCEGGEKAFISQMIRESIEFRNQVKWFTTLVSKEENLKYLIKELNRCGVKTSRVLEMSQGNKRSRVLAWSFF